MRATHAEGENTFGLFQIPGDFDFCMVSISAIERRSKVPQIQKDFYPETHQKSALDHASRCGETETLKVVWASGPDFFSALNACG